MKTIKKILIVRPELIGDTILTTPLISEIKNKLPEANITLLLQSPMEEIIKNNPDVSNYILINKKTGFFELLNKIKAQKFDLSIVLEDNPRPKHAFLCFLAGIPNRIGDKSRLLYGWAYNRGVWLDSANPNLHQIELHGQLLRPLGINKINSPLKIITDPQIDKKFTKDKSLIGIHIGTGGGNKALTPKNYAQIANSLEKYKIGLIGGQWEVETLEEMKKYLKVPFSDFVDKLSIQELLSLIKSLKAFIGVDSGPLHAAAALRIPTVAIFTAKDVNPKRWLPWMNKYIMIKSKYDCPLKCSHRECKEDYCSRGIDSKRVVESVSQLLA